MERITNSLAPLASGLLRLYGIETYITDDSDDRQEKLIDFVLTAEESLQVVTGEGMIYQDPRILAKLDTLIRAEKTVEVVFGPNMHPDTASKLERVGAAIFRLDVMPEQHFVIVDGKRLRIEVPHTLSQKRRTQFFMSDPRTIITLTGVFEKLKHNASQLN
jgi:hypothetical protein